MLELNIKTKSKLRILEKIAPKIQQGITSGLISRFHFFLNEDWADIVFRFDTTSEKDLEKLLDGFGKWDDFDKWEEHLAWGPFWDDILRLHNATAMLALHLITNKERPNILNAGKLVHCILNTLGYRRIEELRAYLEWTDRSIPILEAEKDGLLKRSNPKQTRKFLSSLKPISRKGILEL